MIDITNRLKAIRGLNPVAEKDRSQLDITSLNKGGYIDLNGETWKVINKSMYLDVKWNNFKRRKNDYWITELELFSLNTGESTYIEWEIDDNLEICQTDAMIKLRDIQYNGKNINRKDLEYIADEEEGEVSVDGTTYAYSEDDTWAGLFYKDTTEKEGIPMRAYEFEANNGKCLTVETWHEDNDDRPEREAFLSHPIKSQSIVVLQIEGT